MVVPEVQIADIDACGVAHAVISTSTVSQSTIFADGGLAAELDRQANERIGGWVRTHWIVWTCASPFCRTSASWRVALSPNYGVGRTCRGGSFTTAFGPKAT
jgi:hypothetical protein